MVRKTATIALSIAAVTVTLIITTIALNEGGRTDATVINVAGKQRMLSQRIIQEAVYFSVQPGNDATVLQASIAEFEQSLQDLQNGNESRGIYMPPSVAIAEQLDRAGRLWEPLKKRIDAIIKHKALIAEQTENYLQMTPRLQEATLEVAQMMERRRLSNQMVSEAENQAGLINTFVLLSAAYLSGGEAHYYDEFVGAVESYSATLSNFANHDGIVHGSILALVADNQLLWDGYYDSILKAVDGKKSLLEEMGALHAEGAKLLQQLEEVVEGYTRQSELSRGILQWLQYFFALALVGVLGYSFHLIWDMRDHVRRFIDQSRNLGSTPAGEQPVPMSFEGGTEAELQEAGEHINRFVARVDTLMRQSQQMSEELSRLSDAIGDNLVRLDQDRSLGRSEEIAIDSSEAMNKTALLLSHLKTSLDQLAQKARG
ncbi:MAG: type IV pili methyl-accepting chemotaxis transducer N-terminal domain-containing protein [Campylobacterales bacterium]